MIYFYLITSTLLSLSYSLVITLKCFEIMYPVEYENLKYKFGWYSLKIMTIGNLFYNKCKSNLYDNFVSKTLNDKYKVTFINKDGNENDYYEVNDLTLIPTNNEESFNIIAYQFIDDAKHKTLFFSDKLITDDNIFQTLKESKYSFLAPQIHLSNKTIPIAFLDYNIYCSTNKLFWPGFAKWYLTSAFYKEDDNLMLQDHVVNKETYTISFIDNNMNTIKIKHTEHVILGESDYIIIECIEKDTELDKAEFANIVLDESGPK